LGKFLSFSDKKIRKKSQKNFEGRKVRKNKEIFFGGWKNFLGRKIFSRKILELEKKLKEKNLQNQLKKN